MHAFVNYSYDKNAFTCIIIILVHRMSALKHICHAMCSVVDSLDYIVLSTLHFSQIEAKVVLVRLLQTYTLTLPDDYTIRDGLDLTLHPIGGIPCTILPRNR